MQHFTVSRKVDFLKKKKRVEMSCQDADMIYVYPEGKLVSVKNSKHITRQSLSVKEGF